MKYLLDTHIWLWLLDSPQHLSNKAQECINQNNTEILGISSISAWEIARKESLGKLRLSIAARIWLQNASQAPGLQMIPMDVDISWESCNLPGDFHRDPADQIITATARIHGLTLITKDQRLLNYPYVRSIW